MPAPVVNCGIQMVFLLEQGAQHSQDTAPRAASTCAGRVCPKSLGMAPDFGEGLPQIPAPSWLQALGKVCLKSLGMAPGCEDPTRVFAAGGGAEVLQLSGQGGRGGMWQGQQDAVCAPDRGSLNVKGAVLRYSRYFPNENALCSAEDCSYSEAT